MIKKIGLISSIKETYNDQFEFSYDIKINKFIRSIYRKVKISNLDFHSSIDKDFNLIIICGGNDLPLIKKNKSNTLRYKLTNIVFKKALKKKIPLFGICYGAQFLAYKFKSNFKIKLDNIGNHKVFLRNEKKSINVNSYHNTTINKLGRDLIINGIAEDKSIEYFSHKTKKITGIQWHPERYKSFKKIDMKIIKSLCN